MSKKKTLEEFVQEAIKKHNNKYDYSFITQEIWNSIKSRTSKVPILCPEHGEFWQTVSNHLNKGSNGKYHGCPKCALKHTQANNKRNLIKKHIGKKSNNQFVSEAREIHGNKYEYLEPYINAKTPILIHCNICGADFKQTPDHHINRKDGCPNCRNKFFSESQQYSLEEINKLAQESNPNIEVLEYSGYHNDALMRCKKCNEIFKRNPADQIMQKSKCPNCEIISIGEREIKNYLDDKQINYIHDKPCLEFMAPRRPDFYLPDYKLVIEYDGIQHFEKVDVWEGKQPLEERQKADAEKDLLCESHNIKVLRIPYWELKNITNILDKYFIDKQS